MGKKKCMFCNTHVVVAYGVYMPVPDGVATWRTMEGSVRGRLYSSMHTVPPIDTRGLRYCMALSTVLRADKWNSVAPVSASILPM